MKHQKQINCYILCLHFKKRLA